MNMTILASIVGVVVGFGLQEIKGIIISTKKSKLNEKAARRLSKLYLLNELEKNYELYSNKRGNFSVKERIDNNTELHFSINGEIDGFITNEWAKVKAEVIKLDLELAEKIFNVYQRFEMLKKHDGNLKDMNFDKFDSSTFERDYNEVHDLIIRA